MDLLLYYDDYFSKLDDIGLDDDWFMYVVIINKSYCNNNYKY